MKTNTSFKYLLTCLSLLAVAGAQAAEPATPAPGGDIPTSQANEEAAAQTGTSETASVQTDEPVTAAVTTKAAAAQPLKTATPTVSGEVTAKGYYFDYILGPAFGWTPYLPSYNIQQGGDSNRDHGFYPAIDFNLTVNNGERDTLLLERQDFGRYNHRGQMSGGSEAIGFSGYYSHFRSSTGNIDYLNRPGTANNPVDPLYGVSGGGGPGNGGGGYVQMFRQFNDDGQGQLNYEIERTTYGIGLKFKPAQLGAGTSLALNFDGYSREGQQFATWVANTGVFSGGSTNRWRGYDQAVDEKMGKASLNFTTSPADLFQFSYDGSVEVFDNRARTALMGDFGATSSVTTPLHYTPDSRLFSNAIRLSRTMDNTALAAGYGHTQLQQDSFSSTQRTAGYTRGEISTDNAYFNLNQRFSPNISAEGHVKYSGRHNNSDTSAAVLIDRNFSSQWGVRIADIGALNYGVAATFAGLPLKSSLTAGWKREDTDRVLQYNNITASPIGIWPSVSLYQDATLADEVYLKWVARPMQGMTLRVTPSYVYANKTGLVTEAGRSTNLKAAVGYDMSNSLHVDAYYHYKNKRNDNNSLADTSKPGSGSLPVVSTTNVYAQMANDIFHAAGLALSHSPSEWLNLSASLDWAQNDFATYFFGSDVARYESAVAFDQRGIAAYLVDTWSFSLNSDYQATDRLKLNAGYILSKSVGGINTNSTSTSGDYSVNDRINNTLHSLALGADYDLKEMLTLKCSYIYDYYRDLTNPDFSGARNTLMAGASLRF